MPEIKSAECPVSCATPEILEILRIDSQNRAVKDAAGACMFGTDASLWPAWWMDAVATLAYHKQLSEVTQQQLAHGN